MHHLSKGSWLPHNSELPYLHHVFIIYIKNETVLSHILLELNCVKVNVCVYSKNFCVKVKVCVDSKNFDLFLWRFKDVFSHEVPKFICFLEFLLVIMFPMLNFYFFPCCVNNRLVKMRSSFAFLKYYVDFL